MSNLFQNLTSGLAELKNYYQGPIISQVNDSLPVFRAAEKVKNAYSGLQVVQPLKVRRNQGIGATAESGNLPAIGRQTTVQAIIAAKYNYMRFGVTAQMIKASKSDAGSFVRAVSFEMAEGTKDLCADLNRQSSWDGTGYLAKVSANATSSIVITAQGREGTQEDGVKFLEIGQTIDIVTSGGTIVASAVNIVALSGTSTATITLDTPVTTSSTDLIIRSGSQSNELQGLLYALDGGTTSIYSVNRSTYPSYQGNVINRNGAQLTLDSMQQAWNEGLRRGGTANGVYSAIFCDFDELLSTSQGIESDKLSKIGGSCDANTELTSEEISLAA